MLRLLAMVNLRCGYWLGANAGDSTKCRNGFGQKEETTGENGRVN